MAHGGGEDDGVFHHGERIADADARPAAEGEVGVLGAVGRIFTGCVGSEAFGVEGAGLGPVVGAAVEGVGG